MAGPGALGVACTSSASRASARASAAPRRDAVPHFTATRGSTAMEVVSVKTGRSRYSPPARPALLVSRGLRSLRVCLFESNHARLSTVERFSAYAGPVSPSLDRGTSSVRNSYNVPLSTNGAFEPGWGVLCSGLRALSSETLAEKTSFGGLKDEDRIFTNLYGRLDPFIKV